MAGRMQGRGWLVANEIHSRRAWELAENLERCGSRNVTVLNETSERLAAHFGAVFDRVLLDAPCSGEGMFRKSASARRDWSPEYVAGCALRQSSILEQAGKLVRPGGRLVYATCTFNPQENEAVIARFLEKGEFRLLTVPHRPGFAPGLPEWLEAPEAHPELEKAVRLWPQQAAGEGHFVAVMERAGSRQLGDRGLGEQAASNQLLWDKATINQLIRGQVESFWRETLQAGLPESGRLQVVGSYMYWSPPEALDLGSLRAIHPGWWLGTLKKGRFEPSQALAMGLQARDARRRLDLPADSAQCAAYLRGEVLVSPGADGWLLVCVEGFPLGWGKRVAGVVKNYYPKGLRRAR
jgi:NOL1/NOP2/fmu family ribosome biogenesis protein